MADESPARGLEVILLLGERGVFKQRRLVHRIAGDRLLQCPLGSVHVAVFEEGPSVQRQNVARRRRA